MKKALCVLFVFALFCIPISAKEPVARNTYSCVAISSEEQYAVEVSCMSDMGCDMSRVRLKAYRTNLNFYKNYEKGCSIPTLLDSYAEKVYIVESVGCNGYYQIKDGNASRIDLSYKSAYGFWMYRSTFDQGIKLLDYIHFGSLPLERHTFCAYLDDKPMHINNLYLIYQTLYNSFTPTFIIESEEGRFFGISESYVGVSEIRWMTEDTFLSFADNLTEMNHEAWHYTNEPMSTDYTSFILSTDEFSFDNDYSFVKLQTVAERNAEVKRTVVIVTVCVLAAVAAGAVAFCILKNRKQKQTLAAEAENPAENLLENPPENPAENLPENLPENPPENPAESCPPKE